MSHWEEYWRFETKRFKIVFEVTACEDDLADSFEYEDDIEAIRNGNVAWFDARVRVLTNGREIGADYLGCCAYQTVNEFFTSHRDPDFMNRNCSLMRAERGDNVCICHYFPDMVRSAVDQARGLVAGLRLREVA